MHGWTKDDRVMIACCNDGTRPFIFKIEASMSRPDIAKGCFLFLTELLCFGIFRIDT